MNTKALLLMVLCTLVVVVFGSLFVLLLFLLLFICGLMQLSKKWYQNNKKISILLRTGTRELEA